MFVTEKQVNHTLELKLLGQQVVHYISHLQILIQSLDWQVKRVES